jgi:hypothetical protein
LIDGSGSHVTINVFVDEVGDGPVTTEGLGKILLSAAIASVITRGIYVIPVISVVEE